MIWASLGCGVVKVDEGKQDTEDRLTWIQTSLDIGHTSVWEKKDFCIAQYDSEALNAVWWLAKVTDTETQTLQVATAQTGKGSTIFGAEVRPYRLQKLF